MYPIYGNDSFSAIATILDFVSPINIGLGLIQLAWKKPCFIGYYLDSLGAFLLISKGLL